VGNGEDVAFTKAIGVLEVALDQTGQQVLTSVAASPATHALLVKRLSLS
jgi:hypothetical protein